MESSEGGSGGGVSSEASSLENPQQGQLRSLSAHVDRIQMNMKQFKTLMR